MTEGWICPRCKASNAPTRQQCGCGVATVPNPYPVSPWPKKKPGWPYAPNEDDWSPRPSITWRNEGLEYLAD